MARKIQMEVRMEHALSLSLVLRHSKATCPKLDLATFAIEAHLSSEAVAVGRLAHTAMRVGASQGVPTMPKGR